MNAFLPTSNSSVNLKVLNISLNLFSDITNFFPYLSKLLKIARHKSCAGVFYPENKTNSIP